MTDNRVETEGELLVAAVAPSLGQTLAPYAIALSHAAAVIIGLVVAAQTDGTVTQAELSSIIVGALTTIGVYLVPLLRSRVWANGVKTGVAALGVIVAGVFTAYQGHTPSDWLTFASLVIGAVLTWVVDNAPQLAKTVEGAVDATKTAIEAAAEAANAVHVDYPKGSLPL